MTWGGNPDAAENASEDTDGWTGTTCPLCGQDVRRLTEHYRSQDCPEQ